MKRQPVIFFGTFLLFWLSIFANLAHATTRTVTSLADSGAGTLRDLIAASIANDTIVFGANGNINLTSGELFLGRNLTITGPGGGLVQVTGNGFRVLEVGTNVTVTIVGLTIQNGSAIGANGFTNQADDSLTGSSGFGGGVRNSGTLTLISCLITGNKAQGGSGDNDGKKAIGDGGVGMGGGIYNQGVLLLSNCTVSLNQANGGAAASSLAFSTISTGGSGQGGGIYNAGTASLVNCTCYSNSSSGGLATVTTSLQCNGGSASGGGILTTGSNLTVVNCTFTANSVQGANGAPTFAGPDFGGNAKGGAVYNDPSSNANFQPFNSLFLKNTITAGLGWSSTTHTNATNAFAYGTDVFGFATSHGHNLVGALDTNSSGWTASDLTGTIAGPLDAQLGPLFSTPTVMPVYSLLASSPAIDAGDDAVLSPPFSVTTDQRGANRPRGAHVDIGAYEFGGASLLVTTPADNVSGSLRQILGTATNGDRIVFAPLVTGAISLTGGELVVTQQVSIVGPGAATLLLNGNQSNRVLHVTTTGSLSLSGLTIANGFTSGSNGVAGGSGAPTPGTDAQGGGLFAEGPASLSDCVITNNLAQGGNGGGAVKAGSGGATGAGGGGAFGGGIYSTSTLSLVRCTVSGNVTTGGTGGAGNPGSTIAASGTGGSGGNSSGAGVCSTTTAAFTNCTFALNFAGGGPGGVGGHGTSVPGGNGGPGGTSFGAGINSQAGPAAFYSCTISSNSAGVGRGGTAGTGTSTGTRGAAGGSNAGGVLSPSNVQFQNTIIAGNNAASSPDIIGTVTSQGFNLVGVTDGSSGWLSSEAATLGNSSFPLDPKLGPLQNNGGATPTMALLTGSPALDQGNSVGLAVDQRGFQRPSDSVSITNVAGGDGSDIGAFEVNQNPFLLTQVTYTGNHIQFVVSGQTGSSYVVQGTTNLTNSPWVSLVTNTAPFTYSETNTSNTRRFYRGVSAQ